MTTDSTLATHGPGWHTVDGDALRPPSAYSNTAVVDNGLLLISGQLGLDESGQLVDGGAEAQTEQVFRNIERCLEAAGKTFANVVQLRIYLLDSAHVAAYKKVRDRYVTAPYPTSTLVVVADLMIPGSMIEIDATAV